MFGSRSVAEHLVRGVIGLGALAGAATWSASQPLVWLAAIPVALVAFRGCPMCWTVGLAETVVTTLRGRSAEAAGPDACALHRTTAPRQRD